MAEHCTRAVGLLGPRRMATQLLAVVVLEVAEALERLLRVASSRRRLQDAVAGESNCGVHLMSEKLHAVGCEPPSIPWLEMPYDVACERPPIPLLEMLSDVGTRALTPLCCALWLVALCSRRVGSSTRARTLRIPLGAGIVLHDVGLDVALHGVPVEPECGRIVVTSAAKWARAGTKQSVSM